jgi:hypothetical protein
VAKSRRIKWTVHVARTGEIRNAYIILVGKSEENGPLGRPNRIWEDNIRIDQRYMEWKAVDWIHLAQDMDHWWVLWTR